MSKMGRPSTTDYLLAYESVKTLFEALAKNNAEGLSDNTERNYKSSISRFVEFVNSAGLDKSLTPDDLIAEALRNPKRAEERIQGFYLWLQGKKVKDHKPWLMKGKKHKIRQPSARQRAYAAVRGFYTNNDVVFSKKFKVPSMTEIDSAIETDLEVPFFEIDEKERKFTFDRSLMQYWLSNLKLRDQAVALALLSTGHDSGDLFKLNVGDFRRQQSRERFCWHGVRSKTHLEFIVFFSKEATEFVRRYIQQERAEAKDDDALFVTYMNERMKPLNLSFVYRTAAEKMGLNNHKGFQNPLRPKRLRHIFKTACTHARIEERYVHVFMGHKSDISNRYLEKPIEVLELEYSKLEPMITVQSATESDSVKRIKDDVNELETEIERLKIVYEQALEDNAKLRSDVKTFRERVMKISESVQHNSEEIARILKSLEIQK